MQRRGHKELAMLAAAMAMALSPTESQEIEEGRE